MDRETIIKEVLLKLDNWVVTNIDNDEDLNESNSLELDEIEQALSVWSESLL